MPDISTFGDKVPNYSSKRRAWKSDWMNHRYKGIDKINILQISLLVSKTVLCTRILHYLELQLPIGVTTRRDSPRSPNVRLLNKRPDIITEYNINGNILGKSSNSLLGVQICSNTTRLDNVSVIVNCCYCHNIIYDVTCLISYNRLKADQQQWIFSWYIWVWLIW